LADLYQVADAVIEARKVMPIIGARSAMRIGR